MDNGSADNLPALRPNLVRNSGRKGRALIPKKGVGFAVGPHEPTQAFQRRTRMPAPLMSAPIVWSCVHTVVHERRVGPELGLCGRVHQRAGSRSSGRSGGASGDGGDDGGGGGGGRRLSLPSDRSDGSGGDGGDGGGGGR